LTGASAPLSPPPPAAPGGARAPAPARRDRLRAPLLAAVAAAQLLSIPRLPYPGDNQVARAEAVNLVQRGALGFPLAEKPFAGFAAVRGQYLFENDAKGLMYSKYGFGHTLLYVPVAVAGRLLAGGPIPPLGGYPGIFWAQCLWGVLFAVGCAALLHRLAAGFTASPLLRAAFVVASIYPSFVWHYLRAPTLEVFQIFFFLAFCAFALDVVRAARAGAPATRPLAAATACGGFLLLLRPTFGVLLPLALALALAAGPEPTPGARLRGALGQRRRLLALGVALPGAALLGLWLAVNVVKTGSPLDSGYHQWFGADGLRVNRFALSALPDALRGFFLAAGNSNVLLHHPLLAVALAGWPLLLRARRAEALALLACGGAAALPILFVTNWDGDWCYGPRYLVHAAVVLSLPALALAERLRGAPAALRRTVAAAVAVALAVSFAFQVRMNGVHWFAYQYARSSFPERLGPAAAEWFAAPRYRPLAVGALAAFVREGAPFAPVDRALAGDPSRAGPGGRDALRHDAARFVAPNWGLGDLGRWIAARLGGPGRSPPGG
jgi:hypothetical protein